MINRLAFWMLLPLVSPQALWVSKTAPRYSGASGNNFGVTGRGKRSTLLAIGDSVIAGVGASTLDQALVGQTSKAISARYGALVEWTALGKIGATAGQVHEKLLLKIPAQQFDVIVISVGVNDLTGLKRSSAFRFHFSALLAALSQHSPSAQIAVLGMPPVGQFPLLPRPLRWLFALRCKTLDRIMRKATENVNGAIYIPIEFDPDPSKFAADGYHPSESACSDMGELIGEMLQPITHVEEDQFTGTNVTSIRSQR